jgi:hypothetical protein
MSRDKIPHTISTALMVKNRHKCCVCNEKNKHVQIHHIDGNPNNNEIDNLAVLCLDCHSKVTGDEGLGRKYTEDEIKEYKRIWENLCGSDSEEDREEDQGDCETITLKRGSYEAYEYSLDKGDVIAISVDAEKPLSVFILEADDFDKYEENPDDDFDYLDAKEDKDQIALEFTVEEDGDYVVMFLNDSKRTFDADIDIQIW